MWAWLVGTDEPGLGGASLWSRFVGRRRGSAAAANHERAGRARRTARRARRAEQRAAPEARAGPGEARAPHAPPAVGVTLAGNAARPSPPAPTPPHPAPPHPTPPHPTPPRRLTWTWVNPMVAQGWSGTLEEGDARWLVPGRDEAEPLAAAFDAEYARVLQARTGGLGVWAYARVLQARGSLGFGEVG
jgi:hypothetical protein